MSRNKLPKYVYRGRSAYEYKPYIKGKKGQKRPTIRLCSLDSPLSVVWRKWEDHQTGQRDEPMTVAWLLNQYLDSDEFEKLAKTTKRAYKSCAKNLIEYRLNANDLNGRRFGEIILFNIDRKLVRDYLKSRKKRGSPAAGNHGVKLLGVSWEYALDEGIIKASNPTKDVKLNEQKLNTRYITDEEYDKIYEIAGTFRVKYLRPAIELARLCGLRREEILSTRMSQITDEGFVAIRLKGSKTTLVRWSPRLLSVIESCKATHGNIKNIGNPEDVYLIQNGHGGRISYGTFGWQWDLCKKRVIERYGIADFKFHDLKAKAISDADGDKQTFGGHKTAAMTARYNRSIDTVDTSE